MKNLFLLSLCGLLLLSGCKTVQNDIPPHQIAMKNEAREIEAKQLLNKAHDQEKLGDLERANRYYGTICKFFLETEVAPDAFYAWGVNLRNIGRLGEAFEKFKFVTKNYASFKKYDIVAEEEFNVACELMDQYDRKQVKSKWLSFFKDPKPIIESFQHIVEKATHTKYASKALFYIAELQMQDGEKAKAVEALDRLIENYPDSDWIPDAYLFKAEIYLSFVNSAYNDQGMTRKAIDCYEDFLQLFELRLDMKDAVKEAKEGLQKAKNLYAESRLLMGNFYLYRRHYPEGAAIFYNEARLIAPNSQAAAIAGKQMDFINSDGVEPDTWADKFFGRVIYRPVDKAKQELIRF